MTLAAAAPFVSYLEDGSSRTFAVSFQFKASAEIVVTRVAPDATRTGATLGTDFTVSGGAGATGSVTTAVARAAGWKIEIQRVTPRTQPMDYTPGDTFPAESHEGALDRVTAIAQEIDRKADDLASRALQLPPGETTAPLPAAAARTNTVLGFLLGGVATLLSPTAMAAMILTPLVAMLPAGLRGNPGVSTNDIGRFIGASGQAFPAGTERVRTSGHTLIGEGVGDYILDAAVDAAFVAAYPSASFLATVGGVQKGFRLSLEGGASVLQFGARRDCVSPVSGTDNFGALNQATSYLAHFAVPNRNQDGSAIAGYSFLTTLRVPTGCYRSSGAWEIKAGQVSVVFEGVEMMFPASHGIIIQNGDTVGDTTAAWTTTAYGSQLWGSLKLMGNGGIGTAYHGIWMRAATTIRGCSAVYFSGEGLLVQAGVTAAGAGRGNDNIWSAEYCSFHRNGLNGIHIDGDDTNAGLLIRPDCQFNGRWGILDRAFLNITVLGGHTDGNGFADSGPDHNWVNVPSVVSYGGIRYGVVYGQDAAASTTVPGTNPAVWTSLGAGGTALPSIPAFALNAPYASGGCMASPLGNFSAFLGVYAETGQCAHQVMYPACVVGGHNPPSPIASGDQFGGGQPRVRQLNMNGAFFRGSVAAMADISGLTVAVGDFWYFTDPWTAGWKGFVVKTAGVAGTAPATLKRFGAVEA